MGVSSKFFFFCFFWAAYSYGIGGFAKGATGVLITVPLLPNYLYMPDIIHTYIQKKKIKIKSSPIIMPLSTLPQSQPLDIHCFFFLLSFSRLHGAVTWKYRIPLHPCTTTTLLRLKNDNAQLQFLVMQTCVSIYTPLPTCSRCTCSNSIPA